MTNYFSYYCFKSSELKLTLFCVIFSYLFFLDKKQIFTQIKQLELESYESPLFYLLKIPMLEYVMFLYFAFRILLVCDRDNTQESVFKKLYHFLFTEEIFEEIIEEIAN